MPHPMLPNVFAWTAHIDVGRLTHALGGARALWSWAQVSTRDSPTVMHLPVGSCGPAEANIAEGTHLLQMRLAACTQEEADDGCAA